MKTTLLSIFCSVLLVIYSFSSAQQHLTLPDSNALWLIRDTWSPAPWEMHYNHFYIKTDSVYNDTIINSTVYIKLFEELCNQPGQMVYLGAFRNDISGKVFFCPNDSIEELLMQDYSANEGDTIFSVSILDWGFHYAFNECDMFVDSVRYHYNGIDSVKVLFVRSNYENFIWIDGMGSTSGGIFNIPGGLNTYFVRCFSFSNVVFFDFFYWQNPGSLISFPGTCYDFDCNANISVEEHQSFSIIAYPNPTKDFLYLESRLPEESSIITITDITSRVVYQNTFSNRIDVSHLQEGIYLLIISCKEGAYYQYKIIKQE